ncbi:MAG: sigma 54-interacting transcriptional regulator [Gammaproteobacteria bacterium]
MHSDLQCALGSDVNVLISGGDASARATLARLIYERGTMGAGPFVEFDGAPACELEAQHFEKSVCAAGGGTLFITDIAELDSDTETELMRLLTDAPARPLRVISATAHRVEGLPASQECSAALFYRLNTIHIVLSEG